MGKDKRSRSRKPPENKQEPASRSASAATALRVPLSASSPTFESITGDPSDHEEEMQTEWNADGENLPESLENPQDHYVPQVSQDPVLTDDGPLVSPRIEPSLGETVKESANSGAGEDTQSPTNTDQSTSPDAQKPSFNLDVELAGVGSDGSDGDMRSEAGGQGTSPTVAQTEGAPEAESANAGQPEGIQEEKRKRRAAEERLRMLKDKMKDQRQRFEEEAEKAKKKHEQALQKANQAREAEKVKLEENAKLTLDVEVAKFEKMVEALKTEVEDSGRPTMSNDAGRDMSRQNKKPAMDGNILQAINKAIHAGSEMDPIGRLPTASKGEPTPGNARLLLAECEYLLDKRTPVYTALRVMADYADGGRDWPSEKDQKMLEDFDAQLLGIIKMMEDYMNSPSECLQEARNDWKLAMGSWDLGKH